MQPTTEVAGEDFADDSNAIEKRSPLGIKRQNVCLTEVETRCRGTAMSEGMQQGTRSGFPLQAA